MEKTYKTGRSEWQYGTSFLWGDTPHKYLGPCPDCGERTFDYGGGWRCVGEDCNRGVDNPSGSVGKAPDWWCGNINVFLDGSSWCAVYDGFVNLHESLAGFGDSPQLAVDNLREQL